MQFVTLREQKTGWQRFRGQRGGRGLFFAFEYELGPDPTEEGVKVQLAPNFGAYCPREFWPDIETGLRLGCECKRDAGVRLCSIRLCLPSAKYHDVETTAQAVQREVLMLIHQISPREKWVKPIEPFPDEWLTSTVVRLAQGIHADAAFDRLPILSDALQDAGCADQFVIDHLQMCPDHGTSCWVVEMILDRLPKG